MASSLPNRYPARAILFGAGDFGFNLYWQALSLYLLFFYTDRLGLSPGAAGLVLAAGAVIDGAADLAIGIAADRWRMRYRRIAAIGAVPLGLSFALIFDDRIASGFAIILVLHLLFRLLYAVVNLPYAAWSVRVSTASADRTLMSGARMAFGAAGAVTVALAMPGLGGGYGGTAILFAGAATTILLIVSALVPEQAAPADQPAGRSVARDLRMLAANRAFVTLTLAALGATIAGAIIGYSVLYHFAHNLGATNAGQQALAIMGIVGAITVPIWTALALRIGARSAWLAAAALAIVSVLSFALWPGRADVVAAMLFLGAMQAAFSGFHLSAWAMLPEAVDYGAARTGHRVEATAFSIFMPAQKIGLGIAAGLLGAVYAAWGYQGGTPGPGARDAIMWLMLVGPAMAVAAGAIAMTMNPLRRGRTEIPAPPRPDRSR